MRWQLCHDTMKPSIGWQASPRSHVSSRYVDALAHTVQQMECPLDLVCTSYDISEEGSSDCIKYFLFHFLSLSSILSSSLFLLLCTHPTAKYK